MDREKYLKDTGGIQRIQTIELLDEIERLTEVNKARHVLAKARGKSIEQLKKEKEWLEYKVLEASQKKHIGLSYDEKIAFLEDDMQKALKEGE